MTRQQHEATYEKESYGKDVADGLDINKIGKKATGICFSSLSDISPNRRFNRHDFATISHTDFSCWLGSNAGYLASNVNPLVVGSEHYDQGRRSERPAR